MTDEILINENTARVHSEGLKNDPFLDAWSPKDGAVLLKDKIQQYCDNPRIRLIVGYDSNLLEPASYQLRLGQEYRIEGKDKEISKKNPMLAIPPHGLVIVRTYEWINMPIYLIARWNLKVKMVYKGLVWVGGPQVDPGFQGFLSCPLYNLSNNEVKLKYRDPLFIIDFVRTSYNPEGVSWSPKTSEVPKSLGELDLDGLVSAPKAQLDQLRREVKTMQAEMRGIQVGTMTVLSLVTAIIAIIIGFQIFAGKIDWASVKVDWLPLYLSLFALVLAAGALIVGIVSLFRKL